ncbi:hypothetical protein K502DRAFT_306742 [Neoconidiobolus thromboides FSU 785]|nr:hypothetical protein K502DRAFT_306742 [Neoconidiobolus thromboides FSU 785]
MDLYTSSSEAKNKHSLVTRSTDTTTEVRKLLNSGDPKNRIDVVFMGDGYQLSEKEKFFSDVDYLVKKLFEGVTFSSYFPIYNVWAVYVESKDSGITRANIKKDTAFSLYRPGEELRAIYYPDETVNIINNYCKLTGEFACDYKVVIANDEYYGGVGGDIIISTSSKRSGSVVLNHEMGHTFADVGDEYDNSYAYYGANSEEVKNFNEVKWKHWLTNSTNLREERNINRLLLYPWYNLKNGTFKANFTSDGNYNRWYYRIGISGAKEENSISIKIDDVIIPWKSADTIDRVFYDYFNGASGFSKGLHTLSITSNTKIPENGPLRMVTSVTLHEYGTEEEYKFDGENYSLYPTWDDHNIKRYRPTNEYCVMRNVTSPRFCKVCKESLWLQYLKRLNIIDELIVSKKCGKVNVKLIPLQFAQFRKQPELFKGEKFIVKWFKDNVQVKEFDNLFELNLKNKDSKYSGNWAVKVQLITPEIKKDDNNLLFSEKKFII